MSSSVVTVIARLMICVLVSAFCLSASSRSTSARLPVKHQTLKRQASRSNSSTPTSVAADRVIGKIAFASDRDGNFEIYSMDADGGGQTRLTEDAGEDHSPAWDPDGQRMAFVSTRDGNAEIYVMNADGSGQTRLTNSTAGDLAPAWTRNGLQIGFVTNRDGNDEIYLMNSDGSNQINLTNHPADDDAFSFSGTQDARLFYHAGMIARAAGDRTTAADFLRRALKLNPYFDPWQSKVAREALEASSTAAE